MRGAGSLLLLLLVLVWQPETFGFGSDTYQIGVFTGEGTTKPGLACDGSTERGRVCTGFLASAVDGTLLDVTLTLPPGNGPHPLVAVLHGWGGSKGSVGFLADPLLVDGHAVLRYSARGFGRSWGQVNLADIHVELEDLRSMIGQVVDQGKLHLNPDAVGVTGVSYGGGQSWLALLNPSFLSPRGASVRIRTVVPIVPWTDLVYSLVPNGRPEESLRPAGSAKLSYINGLYFGGLRTSAERPYPNYPEYLVAWHAWLNANEPNNADPVYQQIVDGVAGYRSIWWQDTFWSDIARNRVPIFQVQGLTDDLFPLPEAKRMLLRLEPLGYPIASYFGGLGHPRAANQPAERDYVVTLIRAWVAYYLKELGEPPRHRIYAAVSNKPFNPENVIIVDNYGLLATGTVTREFQGRALVNPVNDPYSGFYWDPLIMQAAAELQPLPPPPDAAVVERSLAVYSVNVGELNAGQTLLIAGQPTVSLRASTTAPRVQLDVRLIDVAPDGGRQLITRGTFLLEGPAIDKDVVIPTYGNVWETPPDHALRLEITNLDSPYLAPSRVPSVTQISTIRLEVPKR